MSAQRGLSRPDPTVISKIRIENFKSIADLKMKLGRVTVLIGENGSGKSNILEAIGFAGAIAGNKLDNDVLFARGIRVTEPDFMRSALGREVDGHIVEKRNEVRVTFDSALLGDSLVCEAISSEKDGMHQWFPLHRIDEGDVSRFFESEQCLSEPFKEIEILRSQIGSHLKSNSKKKGYIQKILQDEEGWKRLDAISRLNLGSQARLNTESTKIGLPDYLIYAPENTRLRGNGLEGFIQPLGTRGEGLFALLQSFNGPAQKEVLADLKQRLDMFGWFKDFYLPESNGFVPSQLQLKDRWLTPEHPIFDQRSANEGFLFVLFYFALVMSTRTPRFFAIDNLDTSLNPKLCSALMRQLVELAKTFNKQVICTTHNPAILDGLNLNDEDQKLYTVQRDADGCTGVNRVKPPKLNPTPMKLSTAFLAGLIGGLPEHF